MDILLVAATAMEIEPFTKELEFVHSYNDRLTSYRYKKLYVDVLITGVGMTQTAFYLGKFLFKDCLLAINAGIGGSFNSKVPIGAVVNVVSDEFADIGAENDNSFLSLSDMNLQEKNHPYINGKLFNTTVYKSPTIAHLLPANGITVNKVHGNSESIKSVYERLRPDIESMEGAAFLYACLSESIPCAQIRAISNYVEKRNREVWDIPLAIKNLNSKLMEIVEEMANV